MIKSRIWSDAESGPLLDKVTSDGKANRAKEVWILLAALALTSILVEIIRPNGLQPLDLFIWRPILIVGCLVLSGLWLKIWFKKSPEEIWEILKLSLPWALLGALVFSLINLWPQDLGSLPLTLGNLPGYFFSLGFWPMAAGPEAILRGFALGLALSIFWREFKAHSNDLKAAAGGVGVWIASSLALALPSLILNLTVAFNGSHVLSATATDLADDFSRLNLNAFWGNLQLTRWFTGFGGQLPNSMALFTLSWVFVLLIVLIAVLFWRPRHLFQFLKTEGSLWPFFFFVTAALSGLLAGWGKMHHSGLDWVAWIVYVILFVFWFWLVKQWSSPDKLGSLFSAWLTPLVLLAGGLLGWPVLLPIIASLLVMWIQGREEFGILNFEFRGSNPKYQIPYSIFLLSLWLCLASASLGFMRGPQYIQESMIWIILAFGCLLAPAVAWFYVKNKPQAWVITIAVWMAVSLVSSLLLKTFLVSALALLGIVASWLWPRFKANFGPWLPYAILIYMSLVMILAFWLPRWLNPRLLPL
ncbi:MAG: hypothetical protein WC750_03410 [Patescibacteria group bacterium]|jgi:hypothetical protein